MKTVPVTYLSERELQKMLMQVVGQCPPIDRWAGPGAYAQMVDVASGWCTEGQFNYLRRRLKQPNAWVLEQHKIALVALLCAAGVLAWGRYVLYKNVDEDAISDRLIFR